MKKVLTLIAAGFVLSTFANCGRNDNGPSAPAGMTATCYYMQTSNGTGSYNYANTANQYPGQAAAPCAYNYSALSAAGFSQANTANGGFGMTAGTYGMCSGSQAMVYSPSKGVGCVDSTRLSMSGQVATYALNQSTASFVPSSAPSPYYQYQQQQYPYSGYNNYGYSGGSYSNNGMITVLRVCDAAEPCPSGQTCRSPVGPISTNTGVGICYF